jgi:hypothetical protein
VNSRHRQREKREKKALELRCLVAAYVWNRAQTRSRRRGGPCMERALAVGRAQGLTAMAAYLERELGFLVMVTHVRGSPPVIVSPVEALSTHQGTRS